VTREEAPSESHRARALDVVRDALVRADPRLVGKVIEPHVSVIDGLGFDSMKFVDLALSLEEALGIEEFPLQEWYDGESVLDAERHTVASLVTLCCALTKAASDSES
jgi:acyl carrier protein